MVKEKVVLLKARLVIFSFDISSWTSGPFGPRVKNGSSQFGQFFASLV